ncbi:MAG: hypothetical protein FWH29_03640 [Methanobrevibacter sp.]|nr:hypothetical protein [Methanobrevibacter sp.]
MNNILKISQNNIKTLIDINNGNKANFRENCFFKSVQIHTYNKRLNNVSRNSTEAGYSFYTIANALAKFVKRRLNTNYFSSHSLANFYNHSLTNFYNYFLANFNYHSFANFYNYFLANFNYHSFANFYNYFLANLCNHYFANFNFPNCIKSNTFDFLYTNFLVSFFKFNIHSKYIYLGPDFLVSFFKFNIHSHLKNNYDYYIIFYNFSIVKDIVENIVEYFVKNITNFNYWAFYNNHFCKNNRCLNISFKDYTKKFNSFYFNHNYHYNYFIKYSTFFNRFYLMLALVYQTISYSFNKIISIYNTCIFTRFNNNRLFKVYFNSFLFADYGYPNRRVL